MSKERKTYLDYHCNSGIVCPYCDYKFKETWEYMSENGENNFEVDCPTCENKIYVYQQITYKFTTVGDCKVHQLWRYGGKEKGKWSYTCQVCAAEYYDFHLHDGKHPKLEENQYVILEDEPLEVELDSLVNGNDI